MLVSNDGIQTVAANGNVDFGTVVNSTGTSITFTAPDTVTLAAGTYLIIATMLTQNTGAAGDIGVSLTVDGTVVPTASEYVASSATPVTDALQHLLTVATGDTATLQLVNGSTVSNNYHDVALTVLKIA